MTAKLLPLADAAAALGVASSTLRHQIRNRKLRAVKRGRDWYVREDEVERYRTESQTRPGASENGVAIDPEVLDAAIESCIEVVVAELDRRIAEFNAEYLASAGKANAQGRAWTTAKRDVLADLRTWIVGAIAR